VNSKQKKTLAAVFAEPTPANIEWQAIESLLVAVGCEIVEGTGSRVRFVKSGHVASFLSGKSLNQWAEEALRAAAQKSLTAA
jgi:hypothetical protein